MKFDFRHRIRIGARVDRHLVRRFSQLFSAALSPLEQRLLKRRRAGFFVVFAVEKISTDQLIVIVVKIVLFFFFFSFFDHRRFAKQIVFRLSNAKLFEDHIGTDAERNELDETKFERDVRGFLLLGRVWSTIGQRNTSVALQRTSKMEMSETTGTIRFGTFQTFLQRNEL